MQPEKLKRLKKIYADLIQELDGVSEKEVLSLYEDATVALVLCDFLALVMDFQKALHGKGYKNLELFYELETALQRAEKLHPIFAEGIYQGLGRVGEEYGELAQSINHGEPMERIEAEAMDLLVVAFRFVRKDYEQLSDCDECKFPCEGCASGHFQNGNNQSEGRK